MEIRCYRALAVWCEAMNLALECYQRASIFPKYEYFRLANQLQCAAISVAELETHLTIAVRLGYQASDHI